jgi:bifunctional DNase/RNase
MVEVHVDDIAISGEDNQFLVLLKSEQDDILPIVIDAVQAFSISMGRSGERHSRPLTHDLILSMLEMFDAEVSRIEITDLIQGTYYAMLVLERSGVHLEVDARPSDALALAVRVEAPIFVAEHVLEQNALTDDLSGGTEGFEA